MAQKRFKAILLVGPPGAGKGTQGKIMGCVPGFYHSTAGDIFRNLDQTTPIGGQVHQLLSRGVLIADDLAVSLWAEHMKKRIELGEFDPARDWIILDGIPRTLEQAKLMAKYVDVRKILCLSADEEEKLIKRLVLRGKLEGRLDDGDKKIMRHRFQVYREQTKPLVDFYPRSILSKINALRPPLEVASDVFSRLRSLVAKPSKKKS